MTTRSSSRRTAATGIAGVVLSIAGLVSLVPAGHVSAAGTTSTKYYFTGTTQDQVNKDASNITATWGASAPSPTTDIIQQLTPLSGTNPANIYEASWLGTLPAGSTIAGSTMHLDWFFSSDPTAIGFGNFIDVTVYTNFSASANTATSIGAVSQADIGKANLPTATEVTTDVPITGEYNTNLLITAKVHFDNAGTADEVHYGSTGAPSFFSFSAGSTPTPSATPSGSATPSATPLSSTCTPQTPEANVAVNGWTCPVEIPQSANLGEPSITHDDGAGNGGTPRLFVAAPQKIGNVQSAGGSPLYTSTDGGATWSAPVRSQLCAGLSGGDSDLAVDAADNVYATDLWLGSSCMSVSEDHGKSFAAGNPYGQELQPGDDRPWLAYSTSANELFGVYDGEDSVRAVSTLPLSPATNGLQASSDTAVIPENTDATGYGRHCACPPGGITVDNSSGGAHSHSGRVFVAYSYQDGMAVSYADPTCANGTCTILQSSWNSFGKSPSVVPNSGGAGSTFQDLWNMGPIKVDGNGTVYVMWAGAPGFDSSSSLADKKGVQVYYAYSTDGGATFSNPIYVSTEDGSDMTAGTSVFPTMDVVSPGVLDMSWYGTPNGGDPNSVPASSQWSAYYTRVFNADGSNGGPSVTTPEVAISDMHNGCIQSGGGKSCTDRSLLDFFQLTDVNGTPDVIYAAGDANGTVNIWFTKLTVAPTAGTVPEAPYGALLLIPGPAAIALAVRSQRRRNGGPLPVV